MDTVNILINAFLTEPLTYIGSVMSLLAAVGFLIFLWGFIEYIMEINGNDAEKNHSSISMVHGTTWVVTIFVMWETIRFIASYFFSM